MVAVAVAVAVGFVVGRIGGAIVSVAEDVDVSVSVFVFVSVAEDVSSGEEAVELGSVAVVVEVYVDVSDPIVRVKVTVSVWIFTHPSPLHE